MAQTEVKKGPAEPRAGEEATRGEEEGAKIGEEATRGEEEGAKAGEEATHGEEEGAKAGEEATRGEEEGAKAGEEATRGEEEGAKAGEEATCGEEEGAEGECGVEEERRAGEGWNVTGVATFGRVEVEWAGAERAVVNQRTCFSVTGGF
ncbi:unnamed protein product [Closterium sp. Yama58-4]|nr:unnamed protein product [Closterium sp. Yama58-4]